MARRRERRGSSAGLSRRPTWPNCPHHAPMVWVGQRQRWTFRACDISRTSPERQELLYGLGTRIAVRGPLASWVDDDASREVRTSA
eukprot:scaffold8877_cov112-Isochrysis_galbana.AAC.16